MNTKPRVSTIKACILSKQINKTVPNPQNKKDLTVEDKRNIKEENH